MSDDEELGFVVEGSNGSSTKRKKRSKITSYFIKEVISNGGSYHSLPAHLKLSSLYNMLKVCLNLSLNFIYFLG